MTSQHDRLWELACPLHQLAWDHNLPGKGIFHMIPNDRLGNRLDKQEVEQLVSGLSPNSKKRDRVGMLCMETPKVPSHWAGVGAGASAALTLTLSESTLA